MKHSPNPEACSVTPSLNIDSPRRPCAKEINYIQRLGVEIKTGVQVGKDISLAEIRKDYQAVFIGVGAQGGMKFEAEGSDLPGVTDGIKFLQAVNLGREGTGRRIRWPSSGEEIRPLTAPGRPNAWERKL